MFDVNKVVSLSMISVGIIGLLSLVSLPGVNNETSFTYMNDSSTIILENKSFVDIHNGQKAFGVHNMLSDETRIATKGYSLSGFLSTCSHEVKHFKFDVEDQKKIDPLTEPEEHNLMGNTFLPWNWEKECVALVPERMHFL